MSSCGAFDEDPRVAVVTTARVLTGAPVLVVSHDEDDGGWQFLDGGSFEPMLGRLVALSEILVLDPSLNGIADLPLGWVAKRDAVTAPWRRERDAQD